MRTLEQLNEELDAKIPRSAVSERQGGGGRSLSYLAGHYVIDRLNKVFGPLNWASDIKSLEKLYEGKQEDGKHYVSYGATVRLVVQGPDGKTTEHTDTGFGDGSDKHPGKPFELARKEAITDALKRCAKNLGQSMGLALYDKEQPNVDEEGGSENEQKVAQEPQPRSEPRPNNPPQSRPSAVGQHADRGKLNERINSYSKIILAKQAEEERPKVLAEIKASMKEKYGTDEKEKLSDAQAEELLGVLKSRAAG